MATGVRHSSGLRRVLGLGLTGLAAAAPGCGSGDDTTATGAGTGTTAAAIQHRLFRGDAGEAVAGQIEHLREQPGQLLASWTFSSPDEIESFNLKGRREELSVQDGALRVPAADKGAWAGALEFEPPTEVPPVFRLEVKLTPGQAPRHLPTDLQWMSARHPKPHWWRRTRAVMDKDPDRSANAATCEVVYWHGPIERFRFNLRHTDQPIEIDEISIYAPELRTVEALPDGVVQAEIDGVAMPSVWALPPSRHETTVRVPVKGRLILSTGVAAESAAQPCTVTFKASVNDQEVLSSTRRVGGPQGAPWQPERVDLGRWAGQQVQLVLETEIDGEAAPPLAFWGAPGVVAVHDDEPPPTVVLVVADTTRADHLSLYGYDLDTTPFLRELGNRSVVFDAAFSQSPWTMPSMCSMLTSAEPWEMNTVWGTPGRIPDEFTTLAECLAAQGYVTGAIVANLVLAPDRGYGRGFDTYAYPRQEMTTGDEITDRALAWVEAHPDEPLFLWVHYIDPHGPYDPPREGLKALFGSRMASAVADDARSFPPNDQADAVHLMRRYDGEIRWLDEQIRRLYEGIREEHDREPLFIFAADHGEAFLEHGFFGHGASVHAQEIHVPLLFSWQGVLEPRRVEHPVRNLDITPTVLDLVGAGVPPNMAGISLRPAMDGVEVPLEAYSEGNSHGPRRAAIRDRDYTYMTYETWNPFEEPRAPPRPDVAWRLRDFLPTRALYARDEAESESRNVIALHPAVASRMQRSINRVEMQRHGGFVVRLRGRLDGPPRASVTLAGRVSVEGAQFVDLRTRLADFGSDEFSLDEDAISLKFSSFLYAADEEWLMFDATDEQARFSLELEPTVGARPIVTLGGEVVTLTDGKIDFDAATATVDLKTAEGHLDHEPKSPLIQIWKLAGVGRRYEASPMPPEVLERLRALGYIGDG